MPADDLTHDRVDDPAASPDTTSERRRRLPWWAEIGVLLALTLVLAVVIKAVLVQAFFIPSDSMEPGLVRDDRIAVQKVSYWFGSPQRGDVVVFSDPGGWLGPGEDGSPQGALPDALSAVGLLPTGGHLVKRVIGVPGDTITCCDARGRIQVNGKPLDEKGYTILDKAPCAGPMTGTCSWSSGPVPEGKIFVMGDNRAHSGDSTTHLCTAAETDCVPGREFVDDSLVVGKVAAVVWPLSHFRRLGRPADLADVPDPS